MRRSEPGVSAVRRRETDTAYEFWVIRTIEIELGDEVITVGKEALFFLGRFLEIGEIHSVIEPSSEGVSFLYTGALEETRVLHASSVEL